MNINIEKLPSGFFKFEDLDDPNCLKIYEISDYQLHCSHCGYGLDYYYSFVCYELRNYGLLPKNFEHLCCYCNLLLNDFSHVETIYYCCGMFSVFFDTMGTAHEYNIDVVKRSKRLSSVLLPFLEKRENWKQHRFSSEVIIYIKDG